MSLLTGIGGDSVVVTSVLVGWSKPNPVIRLSLLKWCLHQNVNPNLYFLLVMIGPVIICSKCRFNVACLLGETALSPWVRQQVIAFGIALLGNNLCRFCFHEENAYQATSDLQLTLLLLRLFIVVAEGSGEVGRRTSKLYLVI